MKNKQAVRHMIAVMLKLLCICLTVAALTALVYAVTKGPIEKGERERKETAIRTIFPSLSSFSERTDVTASGVNAVYEVTDATGTLLGWCVDYTGNSDYGGEIGMMIGLLPDHTVCAVQIMSHSETFIDRYLDDRNLYTGIGREDGSDLSAGATLSYRAIRNAIEAVESLNLNGSACAAAMPGFLRADLPHRVGGAR